MHTLYNNNKRKSRKALTGENQPGVLKSEHGGLKAIYSRSLQSARNLLEGASTIEGSIDLYSEDAGPGRGYADLLSREDVDTVIIACVYIHYTSIYGGRLTNLFYI